MFTWLIAYDIMYAKAMSSDGCYLTKWLLADIFDRQQTDRAKPASDTA